MRQVVVMAFRTLCEFSTRLGGHGVLSRDQRPIEMTRQGKAKLAQTESEPSCVGGWF